MYISWHKSVQSKWEQVIGAAGLMELWSRATL